MCHQWSDQRSFATVEGRSDDRVSDGSTALRSHWLGVQESRRTRRNTSNSFPLANHSESTASTFQDSLDVMPESEMTLWFSGKEMQRGKLLSDSVGKNEKTTMIVKIQKVRKHLDLRSSRTLSTFQQGNSAPSREPVVSEQQQKEMMAYYYRKQQDMKVSPSKRRHLTINLIFFLCRRIENGRKRR